MNSAVLSVLRQGSVFQTPARMSWAAETSFEHQQESCHNSRQPIMQGSSRKPQHSQCYQQTSPYIWACKGHQSSSKLRDQQKLKISSRVAHTYRQIRHSHLQIQSKATAHKGARLYCFIHGVPASRQVWPAKVNLKK